MSVLNAVSAIQVQTVASASAPATNSTAAPAGTTSDSTQTHAPVNQNTPAPTDTTDENTPPPAPAIYTAVASVNASTIRGGSVNITA